MYTQDHCHGVHLPQSVFYWPNIVTTNIFKRYHNAVVATDAKTNDHPFTNAKMSTRTWMSIIVQNAWMSIRTQVLFYKMHECNKKTNKYPFTNAWMSIITQIGALGQCMNIHYNTSGYPFYKMKECPLKDK